MDMTESITPWSDQINAEDLLSGPRTITITEVKRGTAEQPVDILTAEFGPGRAYKPSKTMRRIIVAAWGPDTSAYIGRRITIYRDPDITFGRDVVGGIRISALSKLDKRLEIALTVTRGKRAKFGVEPLPDAPSGNETPSLGTLFDKAGLPKDRAADRLVVTRKIVGRSDIASASDLTADELAKVTAQLAKWDGADDLKEQVGDILDLAAIEAEGTK